MTLTCNTPGTWEPKVVHQSPCMTALDNMSPNNCNAPDKCVIAAHASPTRIDKNIQPEYVCLLEQTGGWIKDPTYGPTGSFCANKFAQGGNLSPGNWNHCVKYGDAWHITAPSSGNNQIKCYGGGNGDTSGKHRELCLHDNNCPLYVQTEAEKKCVRYPTKDACVKTLQANYSGWNIASAHKRDDITKSIIISDSGKVGVTTSKSNNDVFEIVLGLLFIAFCILGYFLLKNVEKYLKKTETSPPSPPSATPP